jgi:hypothetical protein
MSGQLSVPWRALAAMPAAALFMAVAAAPAGAQDCPTAQSAKTGFVLQRGEQQKTDIFHVDDGLVRSVTRAYGTTWLETTLYQGLFELDRLDRGRRTKYEPQADLKRLFPLKAGRTVKAAFRWESGSERGTLSVELAVKGADVVWIGPCKYDVLKIDRTESLNGGPPRFRDTDYYSPELRFSLAKEWRESGGGTHTNKYDRIYSLTAVPPAGPGAPSPNTPSPKTPGSNTRRANTTQPETSLSGGI